MRKIFALIMIVGVLACGLGIYSSRTFSESDYCKALNPVVRTITGHDIEPELVQNLLTTNVSGNLPGLGKFSYSFTGLIGEGVEIPGYGKVSLVSLLGRDLDIGQKLWAFAVIVGYAWNRELLRYGAIAAGVMLFLLIGTHRPKRRY